jgi:hypothetical protein
MKRLGLQLPSGSLTSSEWAVYVQDAASLVNAEVFAFNATVDDLDGDEYLGVIVSEIGYRRTKRAENSARNDLFNAVGDDGKGNDETLHNLNFAKDGWRIILRNDADDALSILRQEDLWD